MTPQASGFRSDPTGVLDAAALGRLSELDPQGRAGLLPRVLNTYANSLDKAQKELPAMREPLKPDAVRHLAHTLKSSSASVGALALSTLCGQIEQNLRSSQPNDPIPQIDALQAELQRVSAAVRRMLQA